MPIAPMAEIAQRIIDARSIWLACHVRPDADALGSMLALDEGLRSLGKQVLPISPDGVPDTYRFLSGWERVATAPSGDCDVAIGLDADGSNRLGPVEKAILAAPLVIDIDHHGGPHHYGHLNHVDVTAAATGELVFALLQELRVEITPSIARNLMAALVTDTGSFHFKNTTPRTLEIAGALMEAGAHPSESYEAVYGTRPANALRLLGHILSDFGQSDDGRVVWATIEHEDLARLGVREDQTEGFINELRSVEGCEAAILFRTLESGESRVSLRSRGSVDVAAVAKQFDGGGHRAAAGCTLTGCDGSTAADLLAATEKAVAEACG